MSNTVDNPFFARLWTVLSGHEPESVRQLLSLLRPGGELRYLEHVASSGRRARLHKLAMPVSEFAIGRAVKST